MRLHILLPTDFSDNAYKAALYAIKLYDNTPCTFYFSHAWTFVNTGARTYIAPDYIDALKKASNDHLAGFMAKAKSQSTYADHEFKTFFYADTLTNTVKTAIEKYKIDFVVMGTKGATGAKEFFMGSNTVTVIDKVRLCPLILVPDNYDYVTPTKIVFPTDFKREFGPEIENLKKIADLHHATIHVLHINSREELTDVQDKNIAALKTDLKNYSVHFNWITEKGRKEPIITDFIQENKMNFIAMIQYEHNFIEDLIREPIVKNIGYHSKTPFLVIPKVTE